MPQNLGWSPQKFPFPGFKESDDSAEVILEPRLIAVEYIFNYFYYIDALASLDLKVQVSESLKFFRIPVNQVKQVIQVIQR